MANTPLLAQYTTSPATVLYIDYENRAAQIQKRVRNPGGDRNTDRVWIKVFEPGSSMQRTVSLFGHGAENLKAAITASEPAVLITDPLRLAVATKRRNSEEASTMEMVVGSKENRCLSRLI